MDIKKMDVVKLIEERLAQLRADGSQQTYREVLRNFAMELLEMVQNEKRRIFIGGIHPKKDIYAHVIDKTLEKLKK